MKQLNQYDFLKIDCLDDVDPVEATASWTVTDSRDEIVTITSAPLPDGSWGYGYVVHWLKGDLSAKGPTPELGKFRTQREAKLHAVGFLKMYLPYFTPDTREALRRAETSLLQSQLFD